MIGNLGGFKYARAFAWQSWEISLLQGWSISR